MEKKGNRSSPVIRGTLTESKKDGASNRQWPRDCRRREPVGGSLSTKNEVSRKPQPQRVKTLDKRPKSRSSYPPVDRNEATRIDEQLEPELGSVFLPGSKKQSLNHLLNFSYTPRETYHKDRQKNSKGKLITTKKHKYNKEHFLQANCQFIVNDSGDYRQYQCNPDALVDWDLVEQVNIQVTEYPSCPICLYPPVAAKMTRCGHIYCWSCVLHYLAISDKPSHNKCPICYESVQIPELKSVVVILHPTFNLNETITFKLMKRLRGSLIAYPFDAEVREDSNSLFGMSEKCNKGVYSKLVVAGMNDIMSIIQREYRELSEYLASDLDDLEKSFVEQALTLLKDREAHIFSKLNSESKDSEEHNDNEHYNKNSNPVEVLERTINNLSISMEDTFIAPNDNEPPGSSSLSKFHFFYQASDGQHIYLHAINARMLEHTYGSLQYSPKIITGKILEKEGGSMTEDLRRRLRYLQHLPVTCQFEVAEINLKPPVITKETLDYFHDQIEARKKTRQRRAKEEKRREKRIEVEENRKIGKHSDYNLHLESNIQFPEFGSENRQRTDSQCTGTSELSSSPESKGIFLGASVDSASSFSGPSFAKMLATEKKLSSSHQTTVRPIESSTSLKLVTATGSNMKLTRKLRKFSDDEDDPEGYDPVPSFSKTFGDAIAEALEQAEKIEEKTVEPSFGKKKKKSKQKVLFTTTMAYSGK